MRKRIPLYLIIRMLFAFEMSAVVIIFFSVKGNNSSAYNDEVQLYGHDSIFKYRTGCLLIRLNLITIIALNVSTKFRFPEETNAFYQLTYLINKPKQLGHIYKNKTINESRKQYFFIR